MIAALVCPAQQPRSWKTLGSLNNARHYFGAVVFAPKQALVMGGYINSFGVLTRDITNSCELIDLRSRTITIASAMNVARAESVFLLTSDSNIVAISGLSNGEQTTPTCELYSRTTQRWTIIGSLNIGRRQHIACFINRDEILIVGGRGNSVATIAKAEVLNIRTGISRFVQDFPYTINLGVAEISSRNKPVFFGGRAEGTNSFRTTDVHEYDAANNRWLVATKIPEGVHGPNALKLWDGRLFFAGGSRQEEPILFSRIASVEAYPQFRQIATIQARHWHTIAQWNADSIAVLGGLDENLNNLRSVEWIDLKQQRSFPAPTLQEPHGRFIALSMPEFNTQGQQINSTLLAISGLLNDNAGNTPTVEILEEISRPPTVVIPQPPPFPTLASSLSETTDCNTFRLALSITSTTGSITAVALGTSANVSIQVLTPLPARSVEITIRVVNAFAPPALSSLRLTDSLGRTQTVAVAAAFPQRQITTLRVLTPLGARLFGDSAVVPTCATVRLRNDARIDAVFPFAYFGRNVEFSAPPSQFPLRIPALGEADMRVCYAPSAEGIQRDTVFFTSDCAVLRVPLQARGAANVAEGVSRCQVPVRLRAVLPQSGEQVRIVAGVPYPQPASDAVSVDFWLVENEVLPNSITATLFNSLGVEVGRGSVEAWQQEKDTSGREGVSGRVRWQIASLPTGLYQIVLLGAHGEQASASVMIVR